MFILACYLVSSASKNRFKSHTDYMVSQFILCTRPGAPNHQYLIPYSRSSVYLHIIIPLLVSSNPSAVSMCQNHILLFKILLLFISWSIFIKCCTESISVYDFRDTWEENKCQPGFFSPECMDMSHTYNVRELTPKWAEALMRLCVYCC